uniref:beta-ketoacyl synthase chain length factor n=1 Tax=Candidatus Cryptobacteroides bacterium TaxID=3085639 RepID=UPI004029E78B
MANRIYIRSAAQISVQKPLCEDWMTDPIPHSGEYLRSQDPDFKQFLNPMQARRMGLILKRAIAVSLTALKDAGIECPDAIFTGTGLGCMENTENFLSAMCRDGEEMLPPTYFMMSTHNTISSAVAILLRCHGYNCTYSQKDISFESALLDAFIQLQAGRMGNALVGSHDETTPDTYRLLRGAGYFDDTVTAAEASSAFVLSADSGSLSLSKGPLCELADVQILHSPANLESIVKEYNASRILRSSDYFTLFGKCFSASGLGVYEAAMRIAKGLDKDILVVNDTGEDKGLVYLKSLCGDC